MNKKTLRIAGWALGLSMAVAGIGIAFGVSQVAPIETKAGTAGKVYVEDSDLAVGGAIDSTAYYVLKSADGYYYTGSISSKWGVTSSSLSNASLLQLSGTSTAFTIYDTESSNYLKYASGDFQAAATGSNFMVLAASGGDSTPAVKYSSSGDSESLTAVLKANTGSSSKMRWYTTLTYSASMVPVKLVKVRSENVAVTGVSLNKTSTSIEAGGTETLTATISPSGATNKNVTWTSSDETVATVDGGVVTALSAGNTTITVTTSDGSFTATCTVTVTGSAVSVTGVSLNKSSTSITVGSTETLAATVAPAEATTKTVTWTSSDETVATVADGVVTAVKKGTATITVRTVDGGFTATCAVTVNNVAVTSVTLNKPSTALYVGETETLTATVAPAEATVKTVSWSSSNTSVATVSAGKITTKAFGTTTITATSTDDGTKYGECVVTVMKSVVLDVTKFDTLDQALTGITAGTTSYSDWSGKSSAGANKSSAIYAGNSAASHGIQLRTDNNNSGIVTTTSGGYAKSISLTWDSNTASGRTVQIYGKNTAYESAADLYNESTRGTLLGSTQYDGSTEEATIELLRPCTYIGIKSSSKPLYLESIQINWGTSAAGYSDIDATDTFINTYMHLDHTTNDGSCRDSGWYLSAKAAYNDLTTAQQNIILKSPSVYKTISEVDWKYSDVKARFEAWAVANNDKAPYDGNDEVVTKIHAAGSATFGNQSVDSNLPLIITIVAISTAVAAGGFFFIQHKRRNED